MRARGYWRWMAEERARERMAKIIDDICTEAEMLDMLWERYYRNGGTQPRY